MAPEMETFFRERKAEGRQVATSVDRIEPTKDLGPRLQAILKGLRQDANLPNKVAFLMFTASSRLGLPQYEKLGPETENLIEEINLLANDLTGKQLIWRFIDAPRKWVIDGLANSAILITTPFIDGMNIVPMEFIKFNRCNGRLILTETTPSAWRFGRKVRGAILIPPRNANRLIEAIYIALDMAPDECVEQWVAMSNELASYTDRHWVNAQIADIKAVEAQLYGTSTDTDPDRSPVGARREQVESLVYPGR
jgi:trehalose 6-phosphate synthase